MFEIGRIDDGGLILADLWYYINIYSIIIWWLTLLIEQIISNKKNNERRKWTTQRHYLPISYIRRRITKWLTFTRATIIKRAHE